jgi:methyl-accepting chemotaxis protein
MGILSAEQMVRSLGVRGVSGVLLALYCVIVLSIQFDVAVVTVHFLMGITAYLTLGCLRFYQLTMVRLEQFLDSEGDLKEQDVIHAFNRMGEKGLDVALLNRFNDERRNELSHNNTLAEIQYAASELTNRSATLNDNIAQQSQATGSIAAAVTQISHSIDDISSRINRAYNSAQESNERGAQGSEKIITVLSNMKDVVTNIEQTYQLLDSLDERTRKVSVISTIISEMADQTNLLALNAAIEAARAGEHGRGFAVVAEEVRALANRSQASAKEINQNIDEVQGHMKAVKSSMETVVLRAEQTVERAQEAETVLEHIAENTLTVSDMVSAIAVASQQQGEAAREISERIEYVAQVADDNSRTATEASSIAGHLYQLCGSKEAL